MIYDRIIRNNTQFRNMEGQAIYPTNDFRTVLER